MFYANYILRERLIAYVLIVMVHNQGVHDIKMTNCFAGFFLVLKLLAAPNIAGIF